MNKCKLCKEELKNITLTCSKGSICMKCSSDIEYAGMQPTIYIENVFWCLAEVFFRRGKGEEVDFEQIWNRDKCNLKMVKFEELIKKRRS